MESRALATGAETDTVIAQQVAAAQAQGSGQRRLAPTRLAKESHHRIVRQLHCAGVQHKVTPVRPKSWKHLVKYQVPQQVLLAIRLRVTLHDSVPYNKIRQSGKAQQVMAYPALCRPARAGQRRLSAQLQPGVQPVITLFTYRTRLQRHLDIRFTALRCRHTGQWYFRRYNSVKETVFYKRGASQFERSLGIGSRQPWRRARSLAKSRASS